MPSFVLQLAALKFVCKVLNVKTQPADIQSYEKFPLYRRACPDSSGGLGGGRKKRLRLYRSPHLFFVPFAGIIQIRL